MYIMEASERQSGTTVHQNLIVTAWQLPGRAWQQVTSHFERNNPLINLFQNIERLNGVTLGQSPHLHASRSTSLLHKPPNTATPAVDNKSIAVVTEAADVTNIRDTAENMSYDPPHGDDPPPQPPWLAMEDPPAPSSAPLPAPPPPPPVTREELGRATWVLLHTLAAQLPDKPSRQQRRDVKSLVDVLTRIYPCGDCATHWKQIVKAHPVQAGSRLEFEQWLCEAHNHVNRSLDKPVYNCSTVALRWAPLDCGEEGQENAGCSLPLAGQHGRRK